MKKDYSEYKHTDYEKYNIARQSNSYVYYDFFINFASFEPDSKLFSIKVDRVNEDLSMKDAIDEFEELERSLRNVHPDVLFRRLRVATQQRPILQGKTDEELRIFIIEALEKRAPHYGKARYRFDAGQLESRRQIADSVQQLRNLLSI